MEIHQASSLPARDSLRDAACCSGNCWQFSLIDVLLIIRKEFPFRSGKSKLSVNKETSLRLVMSDFLA